MNLHAPDWFVTALTRCEFLARYPQYAHVLARLAPVLEPGVQVMAVTLFGNARRLHVNPQFLAAEPAALRAVLLHEVHHVVLGHVTNPVYRTRVDFPDLLQLAMETSANEDIREPLPGVPVLWQSYEGFGLRAGQSTLERYELFALARRAGKLPSARITLLDDHSGCCNPQALDALGAHPAISMDQLVAQLCPDGEPSAGTAPERPRGTSGGLITMLGEPPSVPVLDWAALLAEVGGAWSQRDSSYTRANRRFPNRVGEVPARGRKRRALALLVAIDTSASMKASMLAQIAAHVRALAHYAQLTIAECDVAVQRVYAFRGELATVYGRGDTDLRPVFEPAFLARYPADALVYFTDGDGTYPQGAPGIATLWALLGERAFACAWGRQLRLPVRQTGQAQTKSNA